MVELVWDAGRTATVRLPNGVELTVGGRQGLPPADLAAVGLAASVMAAFIDAARAAGCTILGYLATTDVAAGAGLAPVVRLRSYVVSAADIDNALFTELTGLALDRSIVARLLGDSLDVRWDLRVLHGAASPEGGDAQP
ncbi:MAG TPA: hypothetical protein VMM93_14970 [Vicinamibacterales bacterium]|nr:hypothetical protein [Vicinamibacterales bacterium]